MRLPSRKGRDLISASGELGAELGEALLPPEDVPLSIVSVAEFVEIFESTVAERLKKGILPW